MQDLQEIYKIFNSILAENFVVLHLDCGYL